MFVGSFSPAVSAYFDFQRDVVSAIEQFKAAGVTRLLVDLTNNGGKHDYYKQAKPCVESCTGGYVCLGHFLHKYLSGSTVDYP